MGGTSADLVIGVVTGFTNLFVGLAKLIVGVVQYFGSGLVVFISLFPFVGRPKWAESIFNNGNQMIKTILYDPSSVIKGIINHYYGVVEEEGIVFAAFGYIGGTTTGIKFKAGIMGKENKRGYKVCPAGHAFDKHVYDSQNNKGKYLQINQVYTTGRCSKSRIKKYCSKAKGDTVTATLFTRFCYSPFFIIMIYI